jgi:CheY-like chemotaxis protein
VSPGPNGGESDRPSAAAGEPRPVDVLVIEDNCEVRNLLERSLNRAGYSVLTCTDGTAALDLLAQRTFRLVVTDILMPGLDGYAVIKTVNASSPKPRVLAISGGTLNMTGLLLKMAKHLGCERVLAKPLDLQEFYGVVKELIGAAAGAADMFFCFLALPSFGGRALRSRSSFV